MSTQTIWGLPDASPVRRRRPGSAAAAYSHALAVTRQEDESELIAATALKRGAHSRIAVLAHARHLALQKTGSSIPTDSNTPAGNDLLSLAWQLAGTRPALERAVVDLELRYSLEPPAFGMALGLTTERAAERSAAAQSAWASSIDPAMMAWLGAGSCAELAQILIRLEVFPDTAGETDAIRITIGTLLRAAPDVLAHSSLCVTCAERLKAMTPVHTLVGNRGLDYVPGAVAIAAKVARHRLASPLPPSIEPRRFDIARARTVIWTALIALGIAGAFWLAFNEFSGKADQSERVARLVEAPASSRLLATPTIVTPNVKTAALANTGVAPIRWRVQTSASWLSVEPPQGTIQPSQNIALVVKAGMPPAGAPNDATISFFGDDGSTQVLRYDAGGG